MRRSNTPTKTNVSEVVRAGLEGRLYTAMFLKCWARVSRSVVLLLVIVLGVWLCSLCYSSVLQSVQWRGIYRHVVGTPSSSEETDYLHVNITGNLKLSAHSVGLLQSNRSLYSAKEEYDITKISQNPDIDARGKWQREQIDSYCKKYQLENTAFELPMSRIVRRNLYRHLIFDDSRRLLFCFVPKGIIPQESIYWEKVDEHKYLAPGIQRASFLNTSLTDHQRLFKLQNYYKFMIVRNPLERLLSAFKDKIEEPLNLTQSDVHLQRFEGYKKYILSKYRRVDFSRWLATGRHSPIQVTFSEYIRWIVDSKQEHLNEHFAPTIWNALPCRVKYDFYGNFKMYNSDIARVAHKLQVPFGYFNNNSWHNPSLETRNFLDSYYSQLEKGLKLRLFQSFYSELDFYYHLYPEEDNSHTKLLGIDSY